MYHLKSPDKADSGVAIMNGYWRLYCWIRGVKMCRKCGERLDKDFKARKRGKLCKSCSPYKSQGV